MKVVPLRLQLGTDLLLQGDVGVVGVEQGQQLPHGRVSFCHLGDSGQVNSSGIVLQKAKGNGVKAPEGVSDVKISEI